jgi:hypothetical protein
MNTPSPTLEMAPLASTPDGPDEGDAWAEPRNAAAPSFWVDGREPTLTFNGKDTTVAVLMDPDSRVTVRTTTVDGREFIAISVSHHRETVTTTIPVSGVSSSNLVNRLVEGMNAVEVVALRLSTLILLLVALVEFVLAMLHRK